MCPFCLASMGMIVAGAASTGGLAVLAVKVSLKKRGAAETVPNANRSRNQVVNEQGATPENSVA